jgi:hypothetical protein
VLILYPYLSERFRCWSNTHTGDTTAVRNKSDSNHIFANCYTQDRVQVKIHTVLYLAVSVDGYDRTFGTVLKTVTADNHSYCDTSWKLYSKFCAVHSLLFFYLAHIHMCIGYRWPDTVKFLPEFYPILQF